MRVFIALPVPDDVQDQLAEMQQDLDAGRHVEMDQMHITLAFWADLSPQDTGELADALDTIRACPLDIAFTGLDVFGGGKPRLLAAMVRLTPELDQLHRAVRSAARMAGLELRRQRFRPHVTLARFGPRPSPDLADRLHRFLGVRAAQPLTPFVAEGMHLMQSTLGGSGPTYDLLAEYPLHPFPTND